MSLVYDSYLPLVLPRVLDVRSGVAEYLDILVSTEKLLIFRKRYFVGILTNKANISIQYYLVPYRFSTDSKTRDFE